jgi:hypothetical protein
VCHSIRSMFGVLGLYNFASGITDYCIYLSPMVSCNVNIGMKNIHI